MRLRGHGYVRPQTPLRTRHMTLLLPGDAPGSMGDEAMVPSAISVAEHGGLNDVRVITTRTASYWPGVAANRHYFMPWLYSWLPGNEGSAFTASVSGMLHFVWIAADTIAGGRG